MTEVSLNLRQRHRSRTKPPKSSSSVIRLTCITSPGKRRQHFLTVSLWRLHRSVDTSLFGVRTVLHRNDASADSLWAFVFPSQAATSYHWKSFFGRLVHFTHMWTILKASLSLALPILYLTYTMFLPIYFTQACHYIP